MEIVNGVLKMDKDTGRDVLTLFLAGCGIGFAIVTVLWYFGALGWITKELDSWLRLMNT